MNERVCDHIERPHAGARIREAQAQLVQIEESIPSWINWATVALTVFALWSGLAQYGLLILSLQWARQPRGGAEWTA